MSEQKRIKYFSYYGCNDIGRQRYNSPAADTKIDYIVSVLNRCGYAVDIISHAPSSCGNHVHGYVEKRGENTVRFFSSLKKTTSILRVLNRWYTEFQFFCWCILNLKRGEQVIVYHSLGYDSAFIKLRYLKNLKIIGEIEEIYQDVHPQKAIVGKNEYRFISSCSKYMFPTSLLNKSLNKENKPSLIVHGVYSLEDIYEEKFNDGKIHVVYGGTLDPKKGGAAAAAAAAAFLPSCYTIHICGFGDASQIKDIIDEVNTSSEAKVVFEGELNSNDYKHFIQKCHIGLSTQDPTAAFNATSFPSKVLVYLSNGLNVVSIRIPAIEQSAVSDCIYFYDKQTPQAIAEAIENSFANQNVGSDKLRNLDDEFCKELKSMLETK